MAERRMFSKSIIDSDLFLDMPNSAQCLYFHLAMRADDDGFVNSPKKVQRMIGASDDDCRLLVAKRFLIPFDTGVVVIRHWRIHNYIQKDRYKSTMYQAEKAMIEKGTTGAYEMVDTTCIQDVSSLETQVRLGKDRLGEVRVEGEMGKKPSTPPPEPKLAFGEYQWVKLTQEQHDRLVAEFGEAETARAIHYIDESAQSTGNKNKWKDWNLVVRKCIRGKWGVSTGKAPATPEKAQSAKQTARKNAEWMRRALDGMEN